MKKKLIIIIVVIVVLIAAITFVVYRGDVKHFGKQEANQMWSRYLGDFGFRLLHPIEYRKQKDKQFNVTIPQN